MKKTVLHLNTNLKSAAVTIPYRVHEGFLKHGWNSYVLTANTDDVNKYVNVIEVPHQRFMINIAARIIRNIWYGKIAGKDKYYFFPYFSFRMSRIQSIVRLIKSKPDYIIAHWTSFFFNSKMIYRISKCLQSPVIFYLMDEEPYTGGCHMPYDCPNFSDSCMNCPALRLGIKKGIAYRTLKFKKKWIDRMQPVAVAASEYSYRKLCSSSVFRNIRKEKILLPFDETIYSPGNKQAAQLKLGLDTTKKYILFGAASIAREEKGMTYLLEALRLLKDASQDTVGISILIVGAGDITDKLPFPHTKIGFVNSCSGMAEVYCACDVYLCSSIQDAGPAMINEAMLCGRPVVTFDIGVATDLVDSEVGYIARIKDSRDLAAGLIKILSLEQEEWENVSRKCRSVAVQKCSSLSQLNKLDQIFEGLDDDE
jgi:glycosyltransferase involved in cell wall biosynthesis